MRVLSRYSHRPRFFAEEYETYYSFHSSKVSRVRSKSSVSSSLKRKNRTISTSKSKKMVYGNKRVAKKARSIKPSSSRKSKVARKLNFGALGHRNVMVAPIAAVLPPIAAVLPPVAAPIALGEFEAIPPELMDTSMWEASKNPEEGIIRQEGKLIENSMLSNIEICFSFDTTGSMSQFVNEVKEKMEDIVKYLTADIPNIRISIIAHGDYCDYKKYVLKRIDFSNDPVTLSEFIKTAEETFGGDKEECIELVFREAQTLNWTATSVKALVIISDSIPHEPNEYFKIDWNQELTILKNMGIKIYGVSCGKSNQEFFETISKETGGSALELNRFVEISELISGLAYREAVHSYALETEKNIQNTDENIIGRMVRMPSNTKGGHDDNDENSSGLDEAECFKIHEAIHRNETIVNVKGIEYEISIGRAGCKFVRIGDQTFIEQNKDKNTKYSRMAAEGRKITWIIQRGNWGLIMGERKSEVEMTEAIAQSGHQN